MILIVHGSGRMVRRDRIHEEFLREVASDCPAIIFMFV